MVMYGSVSSASYKCSQPCLSSLLLDYFPAVMEACSSYVWEEFSTKI